MHLYELLKLMSKSLRPSFNCGVGSQIFSEEEIHNIHSDEKNQKTLKTLRLSCQQKNSSIEKNNTSVTLDKNIVRENLVVNQSVFSKYPT